MSRSEFERAMSNGILGSGSGNESWLAIHHRHMGRPVAPWMERKGSHPGLGPEPRREGPLTHAMLVLCCAAPDRWGRKQSAKGNEQSGRSTKRVAAAPGTRFSQSNLIVPAASLEPPGFRGPWTDRAEHMSQQWPSPRRSQPMETTPLVLEVTDEALAGNGTRQPCGGRGRAAWITSSSPARPMGRLARGEGPQGTTSRTPLSPIEESV